MKITYNKNPLYTTVELDEHEKKEMWYKIKIAELEDMLFSTHFDLKEGKIENAQKECDPEYYCTDDKSPLDKRCDELLEYYVTDLQDRHVGDCTCVACSCSKCHAETLLGIDTIPGLGKHAAYKIDNAFGKNNERSIDEAIEHLANYEPQPGNSAHWEKVGGFEQYIPRWKAEAKVAHDWLVNYKNQYF